MRTIVIRRHAERQDRTDDDSHLSQAGIDQARRAGLSHNSFDLVITSPAARAMETAIAMGFAVDETEPRLNDLDDATMAEVKFDTGYTYAAWAEAYRHGGKVAEYADSHMELVRSWVDRMADGGFLLVITHGGTVEALTVGLVPEADHRALGDMAGLAEGVRIEYGTDGSCTLNTLRL